MSFHNIEYKIRVMQQVRVRSGYAPIHGSQREALTHLNKTENYNAYDHFDDRFTLGCWHFRGSSRIGQ